MLIFFVKSGRDGFPLDPSGDCGNHATRQFSQSQNDVWQIRSKYMNTTIAIKTHEAKKKTYIRAAIFLFPALVIWVAISTKCVPIFEHLWFQTGPHSPNAELLGVIPMFLVKYGPVILGGMVLSLVVLEKLNQGWDRHRRAVIATLVWGVNCVVLFGLAAFFTLAMIAFPSLVK